MSMESHYQDNYVQLVYIVLVEITLPDGGYNLTRFRVEMSVFKLGARHHHAASHIGDLLPNLTPQKWSGICLTCLDLSPALG
jgi:hypothetical protein